MSVIVVLRDNSIGQPGGELVVYPEAIGRPLSDVRASLDRGTRAEPRRGRRS